ncbi:hypothetical protein ACU5AX_07780 [Sphingomonas sp. XXL09]|uniref:hypothetical protein n=1 Tax=Sphingomonas sp. XXL09 TaxID=3457787 RepID=UPI00406BA841
MILIVLAAAGATCPYPMFHQVTMRSKADLPAEALAAVGPMAEHDAPFRGGDVVFPDSPPQQRFISAVGRGCEIILTYEHGGLSHNFAVKVIRYADGHWTLGAGL